MSWQFITAKIKTMSEHMAGSVNTYYELLSAMYIAKIAPDIKPSDSLQNILDWD